MQTGSLEEGEAFRGHYLDIPRDERKETGER
jgi:hypothetical protein